MIVNQTHPILIRRKVCALDTEQAEPFLNMQISSFSPDKNPHVYYVTHHTVYRYTTEVHRSTHLLRLQPLNNTSQLLLGYKLTTSVDGEVSNFTGSYGNHASFVKVNQPYSELTILSQSIVYVGELPEKAEVLHHPRTIPLVWMPWDRQNLQTYLQPHELPESELFELSDYAMSFVKKNNNDILEVLNEINLTIFRDFQYDTSSAILSTTPYQTFKNRRGVCQHFADLFICLARLLNIPARYRMGYVYSGGNYEYRLQADFTHAWVEVFLPYMGWIGYDPTNGCMAGKFHVKVACGRYYADATPTSGVVYALGMGLREEMQSSVKVELLNT